MGSPSGTRPSITRSSLKKAVPAATSMAGRTQRIAAATSAAAGATAVRSATAKRGNRAVIQWLAQRASAGKTGKR